MAPLHSTITLCAEIVVSAMVLYSIYWGYMKGKFPVALAGAALLYEILFNVTYMISRLGTQTDNQFITPVDLILAITHGTLSLIMFITLIIFFILAWIGYRKGINYFKAHRTSTIVFIIFWTISVLSGILLYFVVYYTHL
jgi:hypothetical protein